jgi:hypothetical protein
VSKRKNTSKKKNEGATDGGKNVTIALSNILKANLVPEV